MADFGQIGQALSGFSAGVSGQLPQFQQGLANRQKERNAQDINAREKFINSVGGANSLLDQGDLPNAIQVLSQLQDPNAQRLAQDLSNPETQQEAIADIQSFTARAVATGDFKDASGRTGMASAKTEIMPDGSAVMVLPGGSTQVVDPSGQVVTGQARLDVLANSQNFRMTRLEKEAALEVKTARDTSRVKMNESRTSDIMKEMSSRNRKAATSGIRISQALRLASRATQGVGGPALLQISKIFPGIDVSDEAALDQTLGQLAMDQLQNFTGPTTDFEYEKAAAIPGQLGDNRTGNIARLKGLQRAEWFNKRQFEQFRKHTSSGGDADTFSFNFGEPIKTKKGVYTLQDIQDTAVDGHMSIEEVLKRLNK